MEYKRKNILVIGLGFFGGGVGVTKFLLQQGARVTVTDIKTKKELAPSLRLLNAHKNLSFVFGGYPKNVAAFDMVILNPAIDLRSKIVKKIRRLAGKKKIKIESEIGLFLKNCKGKIIAITGTKGKGTTASLVYKMLARGGKKVMLGGNIGGSLLESVRRITPDTFVVLEISSFQLDFLRLNLPKRSRRYSFYISALTNIYPDHLDRYNSFADYKKSKLSIFMHSARYKMYGSRTSVKLPWWIDKKKIKLIGEHNKKNIAIAIRIAEYTGIKKEVIAKAIYSFKGLPYRLEFVGKKNGISFYNDSYSTTPDSTIAALKSFDLPKANHPERSRRTILLLGGVSKGASFAGLAREAQKYAKQIIVFGKSAFDIENVFKKYRGLTPVKVVKNLKRAIQSAKKIAAHGDIILFSPACASFDQFRNASERGEVFKKLIGGGNFIPS